MNKYKEALNILKIILKPRLTWVNSLVINRYLLFMEELVVKATPKEPIYLNECEEWRPIFGYICPCCSDWVNKGANYCSGCGQAILWGEEDVD